MVNFSRGTPRSGVISAIGSCIYGSYFCICISIALLLLLSSDPSLPYLNSSKSSQSSKFFVGASVPEATSASLLNGVADISSFFVNVTAANLTDSLRRVKAVPFKLYEYKYDNVPGRRSMGVIGPDAITWFPDSVEVVPQYPLPQKDRSKKTVILQNFPVIDKNVIYMHGVASMQALAIQLETVQDSVSGLLESLQSIMAIVGTLEVAMNSSISEQIYEKLRLSELELQIANKTGELSGLEMEYLQKEALDKALEVKELLDYESVLVKKRLAQEESLARELMDRKAALEAQLAAKRDQLRKESQLLIKAKESENLQKRDLRQLELEKAKLVAEAELQAKHQREQEAMSLKQIELQAKLDTERVLQTVKSVAIQIKTIIGDLMRNPAQVAIMCSIVVALMAAFYTFKQLIAGLRTFIQSRLGRPMLVRETSMESAVYSLVNRLFSRFRKNESLSQGAKHIDDYFKDVILTPDDKSRVVEIALATRNTKASGVPYRHVLLHGPPGTGKTLIARKLAQCSGMDYAILSGGDVGPLGEDAVNQLHALFAWAAKSRKGLLVFIDEAEAFLSSRGSTSGSGPAAGSSGGGGGAGGGGGGSSDVHLRHALNALLYQTGTQSTTFMLVLATNRPQDLDPAVLDRIDMTLLIDLPKLKERSLLVNLYLDLHIKQEVKANKKLKGRTLKVDESCYASAFVESISSKLEGFSGREVSKLFISAQYALIMAEDGLLTQALMEKVVANKLVEHAQRQRFTLRSL